MATVDPRSDIPEQIRNYSTHLSDMLHSAVDLVQHLGIGEPDPPDESQRFRRAADKLMRMVRYLGPVSIGQEYLDDYFSAAHLELAKASGHIRLPRTLWNTPCSSYHRGYMTHIKWTVEDIFLCISDVGIFDVWTMIEREEFDTTPRLVESIEANATALADRMRKWHFLADDADEAQQRIVRPGQERLSLERTQALLLWRLMPPPEEDCGEDESDRPRTWVVVGRITGDVEKLVEQINRRGATTPTDIARGLCSGNERQAKCLLAKFRRYRAAGTIKEGSP